MAAHVAIGDQVAIRRPSASDREEFVALMLASRELHYPWVDPPKSAEAFDEYLRIRHKPEMDGFLVCVRDSGAITGYINLNVIVRGFFQSCFLGYAMGAPYAGKGYMTEAMRLVTRYAFDELKLHRVEANIQPANVASIAVVRACGFRKEGFSPRYLQVFGEWRDHERWALLADEVSS